MKSIAALLIVVMVWFVGLLAFTSRVDQSTPPAEPPVSDGVVGADRQPRTCGWRQATKLLEAGKGKRLLISGVNREASRDDVLGVTKAVRPIYDCCVDLGYAAADTIGNASESAEWAKAKDYHSLIVVTADYHMPRSMLELHAAMPDVDPARLSRGHRKPERPPLVERRHERPAHDRGILQVPGDPGPRGVPQPGPQGKGRRKSRRAGEGSVLIYLRSFLFQLFFWLWSVVWAIGMIVTYPCPVGPIPGRCRPGPRA